MKTGSIRISTSLLAFILLVSCDITSGSQNLSNANPTIRFDSRGGTVVKSQAVEKNSHVAEPESPVRMYYTFNGWFREPECNTAWDFVNDTAGADVILYAGWAASIPSGLSEFALVNSQTGSSSRLDIIYNKEFSGEISYIVSDETLEISTVDEFDNSGAQISTKTITSDDLVYDDYIPLTSLAGGTRYYVCIKYGSEIKSLSRTTYANSSPGHAQITGAIAGQFGSYDYTITFPENYGVTNEKWPFLVAMKIWGLSDPDFPCVVLSIDIHSGNEGDYLEIETLKRIIKDLVENPGNGIDPERIYMFGYSAGGNAAILMADNITYDPQTHQSLNSSYTLNVKAIMAEGVSSWVHYNCCENLGNTDIWLFYGENDSLINTQIIDKLNTLSGTGEHMQTIMPGIGHTPAPIIDSPHAMMWLLSR